MRGYYAAAQTISEHFYFGHRAITYFGPGYPCFLSLAGLPCGLKPICLITVQVVLSACGSVLLAMFAFRLTGNRTVSLVVGFLNACSLLSIMLSCFMWSETLLFVLTTSAFVTLLSGLQSNRSMPFIFSGLLFSVALLTRSLGQYLPLIAAFLSILYVFHPVQKSNVSIWRRLWRPGLTVIIPVLVSLVWIARNEKFDNHSYLTLAIPHGIGKVVRLVWTETDGITYEQADQRFREELEQHHEIKVSYARALSDVAPRLLAQQWWTHPVATTWVIVRNALRNMTVDSTPYHLAFWGGGVIETAGDVLRTPLLNLRGFVSVLLSIILLAWRKERRILISLLLIYAYFGAASAFALNQGSRIFYPGQIASTVLLAYLLVALLDWVKGQTKYLTS